MRTTISITLKGTNLWHEVIIFQLVKDTQNVSLGHEVGNLKICIEITLHSSTPINMEKTLVI
jgi:hypothetical protein